MMTLIMLLEWSYANNAMLLLEWSYKKPRDQACKTGCRVSIQVMDTPGEKKNTCTVYTIPTKFKTLDFMCKRFENTPIYILAQMARIQVRVYWI